MRNVVFTLFMAVAVFLGSSHASAFSHHHDDAAPTSHSFYHSDVGDADHVPAPGDSDDPGAGQLSHSHCAMASLTAISPIMAPDSPIGITAPPLVVTAMSSLGLPPPLEPPSA